MRSFLVLIGLVAVVLIILLSLGMISIGGGSLPKVNVEAGSAPKVDVGTIDVGTVNKTVEVPAISVTKADNAAQPQ